MSLAPVEARPVSPAAAPPGPSAAELYPPVKPSKPGALKMLGEVLDHAGPGYLQFAITNICNADCDFCGFARSKFDPCPLQRDSGRGARRH
jgi:hypothetical protein